VRAAGETYPGRVLDLRRIDLEEIANALADLAPKMPAGIR
jgi:hypothetical protein